MVCFGYSPELNQRKLLLWICVTTFLAAFLTAFLTFLKKPFPPLATWLAVSAQTDPWLLEGFGTPRPRCFTATWGFPKSRGTLWGVPIIGIIIFVGLYWGPLILRNYYMNSELGKVWQTYKIKALLSLQG